MLRLRQRLCGVSRFDAYPVSTVVLAWPQAASVSRKPSGPRVPFWGRDLRSPSSFSYSASIFVTGVRRDRSGVTPKPPLDRASFGELAGIGEAGRFSHFGRHRIGHVNAFCALNSFSARWRGCG